MNKLGKKTRTGRWALTDTKTEESTYSMVNVFTIRIYQGRQLSSNLETALEAL